MFEGEFVKEKEIKKEKNNIKDLKIILHYLKDKKLKLIIYVIILILGIIPQLLYGLTWGFALQALVSKELDLFLIILSSYYFICIFFNCIVYIIRNKLYKDLEITFIRNVSKDLYRKIDSLPSIAFEEIGVGEFINRLSRDPEQILNLLNNIINLITRSFVAIIVVIFSFSISYILGIEVIVFAVLMGIMSYIVYPKIKKAQKEINKERDNYVKNATENITGIREIKSLGIKENIENKLFKYIEEMFVNVRKSNNYEVNYRAINSGIYFILEFIIIGTCGYYFISGHIVYATFMMMNSYLWRIDYVVDSLSEFVVNYNKVIVSINRINEILNNKLYKDEKFGNVVLENPVGKITFKDVKFRYRDEEEDVLKNINMELLPNRKIAIVGRSGNGKSTIFNLLLRYFDASSGEILIDGVKIENLTEKSLRNTISVIRQSPFLFNMSLLDNFKLVKPDVTLEEVRNVCKKAYIDEYIMSLPNKYDTVIGEGGINLSGGQKQRIAIARTLLLNTKIILFDEATSALDNESQEYIKKTIDDLVKEHTIIIIAHRLSTIVDADEIHVIHGGTEVSCGKHEDLIKNSKIYKKLYTSES